MFPYMPLPYQNYDGERQTKELAIQSSIEATLRFNEERIHLQEIIEELHKRKETRRLE